MAEPVQCATVKFAATTYVAERVIFSALPTVAGHAHLSS